MMKKLIALAFAGLLSLVAAPAFAWDGYVTGVVSQVDVTDAANAGLRVQLAGVSTAHCTGGVAWSYLNAADSNYATYLSTLLQARALGSTVALYLTAGGGLCHIGYISISN